MIERLTLIFTFLTLVVSYLIYKKFLEQDFTKEQLKLVIKLIDELHNSRLYFSLYQKEEKYCYARHWHGNIFELSNLGVNEMDEYAIYIPNSRKNEFGFLSFLSNPMLPKSITMKLAKLNDWSLCTERENELQDFIILGVHEDSIDGTVLDEDMIFFSLRYCSNFKQYRLACRGLNMEIIKWLNRYGIKDLNSAIFDQRSSLM